MSIMQTLAIILPVLFLRITQSDITIDLKYLASIFPGVYDNHDQYENDIIHGVLPQERHLHMTSSVVVEDVPVFNGRDNFYLEQYQNGNKSDFTRQKLYTFYVDGDKRIRLEIYSFVNPAKFAHAEPNSSLFKNLTKKDVVYSVGCDLFWTRISYDMFKSHMYNTCIAEINNVEFIITDTNYLTSDYLTVNEKWTFAVNGSVFKFNPVPYNETKQSSNTRLSKLVTFDDMVQCLKSGRSVSYFFTPSLCEPKGQGTTSTTLISGNVTTFHYITGEYGPYLKFQTTIRDRNATGDRVMTRHDGVVYKTGDMKIQMTSLTPDYRTVLDTYKYLCRRKPILASSSLAFFTKDVKITDIVDFETFLSALQMEGEIAYTVQYGLCRGERKGTGGGKLADFKMLFDDRGIILVRVPVTSVDGNHRRDIISGNFYFNSSGIILSYQGNIQCEDPWHNKRGSISLYSVM